MKMKDFPYQYATDPVDDAHDAWYACADFMMRDLGSAIKFRDPDDDAYVGSDGEWRINFIIDDGLGQMQTWDCHAVRVREGLYRITTK